MVKIFYAEIDLGCGFLSPQHVNSYCRFCAASLLIFPLDLNRVVKICSQATANPLSVDFVVVNMQICSKICNWGLAVGYVHQECP